MNKTKLVLLIAEKDLIDFPVECAHKRWTLTEQLEFHARQHQWMKVVRRKVK